MRDRFRGGIMIFLGLIFLLYVSHTLPIGQTQELVYQSIESLLAQYKRPITLLEIHQEGPCYSFEITNDYDATCVVLAKSENVQPIKAAYESLSAPEKFIVLSKGITHDRLLHLADCEHFDITLALHLPKNLKKELFNPILNLGDYVVIDLSENEEKNLFNEKQKAEIEEKVLLCSLATTKVYLLKTNKKHLKRRTWLDPRLKDKKTYFITSSFEEKLLCKRNQTTSVWHPGINCLTFKMLNGTIPSKHEVKKAIKAIRNIKSSDWLPQNIILQGKKAVLIDLEDERRKQYYDLPVPENVLQLIYDFIDADRHTNSGADSDDVDNFLNNDGNTILGQIQHAFCSWIVTQKKE